MSRGELSTTTLVLGGVALVACCLLPALIGAGAVATLAGLGAGGWVAAAAAVAVMVLVVPRWRRHRSC